MSAPSPNGRRRPVIVAYDGSDDAANAIACAGRVLGPREALSFTRMWDSPGSFCARIPP
jgi:hypothetical protein